MNSVFVAMVVCVLPGKAFAALLGDFCINNDACKTANTFCQNDFASCSIGTCECKEGFTENSGGTVCLSNKGIDDPCSSLTSCKYGSECDTGNTDLCKCPTGETYNALLMLCVSTNTRAISEICSSESECYGYSSTSANNKVKCEAASGSSTKYCLCLDGYITENNMCRKPHATEDCTTDVGCEEEIVSGDASQVQEQCQSGTCKCPSTADQLTRTLHGTTSRICLLKYTLTLKGDGDACALSNECDSKVCDTCAGESRESCVILQSGSGALKVGAFSLSFAVVAMVLTLLTLVI